MNIVVFLLQIFVLTAFLSQTALASGTGGKRVKITPKPAETKVEEKKPSTLGRITNAVVQHRVLPFLHDDDLRNFAPAFQAASRMVTEEAKNRVGDEDGEIQQRIERKYYRNGAVGTHEMSCFELKSTVLPKVKALEVGGDGAACPDGYFQSFGRRFKNLESLNLRNVPMRHAELKALSKLPKLSSLALSGNTGLENADEVKAALLRLKGLEMLEYGVPKHNIDRAFLASLAGLKKLSYLDLFEDHLDLVDEEEGRVHRYLSEEKNNQRVVVFPALQRFIAPFGMTADELPFVQMPELRTFYTGGMRETELTVETCNVFAQYPKLTKIVGTYDDATLGDPATRLKSVLTACSEAHADKAWIMNFKVEQCLAARDGHASFALFEPRHIEEYGGHTIYEHRYSDISFTPCAGQAIADAITLAGTFGNLEPLRSIVKDLTELGRGYGDRYTEDSRRTIQKIMKGNLSNLSGILKKAPVGEKTAIEIAFLVYARAYLNRSVSLSAEDLAAVLQQVGEINPSEANVPSLLAFATAVGELPGYIGFVGFVFNKSLPGFGGGLLKALAIAEKNLVAQGRATPDLLLSLLTLKRLLPHLNDDTRLVLASLRDFGTAELRGIKKGLAREASLYLSHGRMEAAADLRDLVKRIPD